MANPVGRPPLARSQTDIRPPIREDDSRARAAQRIAELRDQRNAVPEHTGNEFDFPLHKIPDGWEYQWKRHTTWGKDIDNGAYLTSLDQRGWKPVPASRHPQEMPIGYSGDTIVRKGLILMELPKELVKESRRLSKMEADRVMSDKKASLGTGTTQLDSVTKQANVKTSYEAHHSTIPDE